MNIYTATVLASDFIDNRLFNCTPGETGCPIERALYRVGLHYYQVSSVIVDAAHVRVGRMFNKEEPIQDFTFTFMY